MEQIIASLENALSQQCGTQTPGYALAAFKQGETCHLAGGRAKLARVQDNTIHTTFDAGSIAKTLTGLSISLLEEEGKLSIDRSVRDYVPQLPGFASGVTLQHLLAHESGLHNYSTLLYYMAGWHQHAPPSPDDVLRTIARTPGLKRSPGTQYEYADTNYFLLARVIECVCEMPFGAFVKERIFRPLGMEDSYCTDATSNQEGAAEGYVSYPIALRSPFELRSNLSEGEFHPVGLCYRHVGAEGFRTSAHDLLRLGRELLSPSAISADILTRALTPHRIRDDGLGYGYGLNVGTYLGLQFLGHDGQIEGFTASLSVFPEHDLVIACLTNWMDLGAWSCRRHVLKELLGVEPSYKGTTVRVTQVPSGPKPGRYLDPVASSVLEILEKDDGLFAVQDFGPQQSISFAQGASCTEEDAIVLEKGNREVTYLPFLQPGSSYAQYAGEYA